MEQLPKVLTSNYAQALRSIVQLPPPEFMTFDDLPDSTKRWVYEGLANKCYLVEIKSEYGHYTDMLVGEVPDPVWGTKSVIAVNRRILVTR